MPGGWERRDPVRLGEVDSTQTEARRLAEAGAPEGTVVQAEHQTHGRGRLGRPWVDEPGAALLTSIVLRPSVDPLRLPQLCLVAGVAAAEAVGAESGLPVELSWPNDVLVRGRKVAGILAESYLSRDGSHVVILGIGINVNQRGFPQTVAGRATSLALEAGSSFDRDRLLRALLRGLEAWYGRWRAEGFAPVRQAWRGRPGALGRRVTVDSEASGIALDLADDGALMVRTDAGTVVRCVSGDPGAGEA